jgi:chromosome segregation ATPase
MISFVRRYPISTGRVVRVLVVLLLPSVALAQQRQPESKKSPSLTTEDMVKPAGQSASATDGEVGAAKIGDADAQKSPPQPAGETASPEELAWREQVANARARVKATERTAEEAELRITALRNQLSASGQTPQARNETAAELNDAGLQLTELRSAAKAAADELARLLESGRLNRFSETKEPGPTLENGNANLDYYKSRYAALNEALETAERQVQLYDNRVRDVSQRILQTGGKNGGDNFYLAHLQQEREEAQRQLNEARAASEKVRSDLAALKEEARRAGVPPGVFR